MLSYFALFRHTQDGPDRKSLSTQSLSTNAYRQKLAPCKITCPISHNLILFLTISSYFALFRPILHYFVVFCSISHYFGTP